ncbi:hypothetical protein COD45_22130 [Escherichia coli]|nr:hypothetical protein COD45_22130 [Escherichia coli]
MRTFSAKQFTATRGKKVFFCIGFAFIYHVLCKPYFIEARRIANTCTLNKSDQFIDRNLNPKKIKKTPQNGCLFNTACVP